MCSQVYTGERLGDQKVEKNSTSEIGDAVYLFFPFYVTAHSKPVRGVAVDAVNMEIFSGSADSTLKVDLLNEVFICSLLTHFFPVLVIP